MQMVDRLATLWAGADDEPVACVQFLGLGHGYGRADQMTNQWCIVCVELGQRSNVPNGHNQNMRGGLRSDVVKGDYVFIAIDDLGGSLARHDLAKDARCHVCIRLIHGLLANDAFH